ncbi:uncharacterized protein LOC144553407 [Carex rostrata]
MAISSGLCQVPQVQEHAEDRVVWLWTRDNEYSANSFYKMGRLLTHDVMIHRGLQCDLPCECDRARRCWTRMNALLGVNILQLGYTVLATVDKSWRACKRWISRNKWGSYFFAVCWFLWRACNKKIFEEGETDPIWIAHHANKEAKQCGLLALYLPVTTEEKRSASLEEKIHLFELKFLQFGKRLQETQKMNYLCEKIGEKMLDKAITAVGNEIEPYVTEWCWNQAIVQEMHRKFEELLVGAKMVNPMAQQSNTANLQVQQLLRELQNEIEQGKELLDGQPTPVNLSNAKERFERIRVVALKLNDLLLSNAREAGVHTEMKQPQFKPRYLNRPTRFQGLSLSLFLSPSTQTQLLHMNMILKQ